MIAGTHNHNYHHCISFYRKVETSYRHRYLFLFINTLATMSAMIGSTIVVTLPHARLRENITREEEMRDANHTRGKETPVEDIIIVREGEVTQGKTVREGGEKRRRGSRKEGDLSRLTGTRGVCMRGRRMTTRLIKGNCSFLLKGKWLAETTGSSQILTLRWKISKWKNIRLLRKHLRRELTSHSRDLARKVLISFERKLVQVIQYLTHKSYRGERPEKMDSR